MRQDTKPESSRTHPRESSFISLLSGWAQQGVQSYFATQRILLDLTLRQNASVMHVLQERLSDPHHSPTTLLAELASDGTSNLMEAQQVLLDLAKQQNEIVMSGVKERVGTSSPAIALTDLLRRSVGAVVEMQQEFLKIADKQTQNWMYAAKAGKALKNDALVTLAREALENVVQAEKKFLDIVAEETSRATGGKHITGTSKKLKKTKLTELAQQVTESFIDAQKKLFDLAGRQMYMNLKAAGRTIDIAGPVPIIPFSDLTREGVKTFVDAQKALMNAVAKPHNGHKPAKPYAGKKRAGRKPVHTPVAV